MTGLGSACSDRKGCCLGPVCCLVGFGFLGFSHAGLMSVHISDSFLLLEILSSKTLEGVIL